MAWQAHDVVFRLRSPLHIGWKTMGNVQYCRGYLPGWALWGAITARLCRDRQSDDYELVGREVRRNLAFSHFYLSEHGRTDSPNPWGETAYDFSWRFQASHTSTALANGYVNEEGSLHETEYIAPVSRHSAPVLLSGRVFVQNDGPLGWRDTLSRLQIGGERSYGWGRVGLESCSSAPAPEWHLGGGRPRVTLPPEAPVRQHLLVQDGISLRGSVETVVRRYTDPKTGRFGARLSTPRFCWTPDSQPRQELQAELTEESVLRIVE